MSILQSSFIVTVPQKTLSSSQALLASCQLFPSAKLSSLSLTLTTGTNVPSKFTMIRMGKPIKIYPGGFSKWQWLRIRGKQPKNVIKARLAQERKFYHMRKRAELKAAVIELERPWEGVEKPPPLFSMGANEQLKPRGFDMWSDEDDPELFTSDDESVSVRVFPEEVVRSIKPYGNVKNNIDGFGDSFNSSSEFQSGTDRKMGMKRNGQDKISGKPIPGLNRKEKVGYLDSDGVSKDGTKGKILQSKSTKKGNQGKLSSDSKKSRSQRVVTYRERNGKSHLAGGSAGDNGNLNDQEKFDDLTRLLYELSLRDDGSYEH